MLGVVSSQNFVSKTQVFTLFSGMDNPMLIIYYLFNFLTILYLKNRIKKSILEPILEVFRVVYHSDRAVLKVLTLHLTDVLFSICFQSNSFYRLIKSRDKLI